MTLPANLQKGPALQMSLVPGPSALRAQEKGMGEK